MRWILPTRVGRRLLGFLILSLGAHALAFSLFRDPGILRASPQGAGKVILSNGVDGETGLATLFDPSAIVLPSDQPKRLASNVTLPWEEWRGLKDPLFLLRTIVQIRLDKTHPWR